MRGQAGRKKLCPRALNGSTIDRGGVAGSATGNSRALIGSATGSGTALVGNVTGGGGTLAGSTTGGCGESGLVFGTVESRCVCYMTLVALLGRPLSGPQ